MDGMVFLKNREKLRQNRVKNGHFEGLRSTELLPTLSICNIKVTNLSFICAPTSEAILIVRRSVIFISSYSMGSNPP